MRQANRWLLRDDRVIDLSSPRLMGVLNLTPDSFHAPSRVPDGDGAAASALFMQRAGADILDLGAESTRPGSARVPAQEQIARLRAALDALDGHRPPLAAPWSIDTTSSQVARFALARGAAAINDVSAGLDDPDLFALASEHRCGLILMHRALPPEADSYSDRYATAPMRGDVAEGVRAFLLDRAGVAMNAGVERDRICLDPGFGFGKTVEQNLELVRRIDRIIDTGFPVLAGISRKSFVGRVGEPLRDTSPQERLPATLALGLALVDRGVRLLRVHDVREHAAAIRAWQAVTSARPSA